MPRSLTALEQLRDRFKTHLASQPGSAREAIQELDREIASQFNAGVDAALTELDAWMREPAGVFFDVALLRVRIAGLRK